MFERECTLYDFTLGYARLLNDDIDDVRYTEQPAPGMNHPAWIMGHLALCTDFAAGLLGLPQTCPEPWSDLFGPGSTPSVDRSLYPGKHELLDALAAGHRRVVSAAREADPAAMAAPHTLPFRFLREPLPTVGDLLAHLMTTHEAAHLGQLSAWRRVVGLPGVLQL